MDDSLLRNDVLEELDWEPSLNAAAIGVSVEGGVVTLTGHVATLDEKVTAEAVARRVRGVRAIAMEIEVRPPEAVTDADDEIARRALQMLTWDVKIPPDTVQLKVEQGWITLTGEVDWEYQRKAATEDVRKLNGVLGVTNLIKLNARFHADNVKQRIEEALKRNAHIESEGIRVSVSDGTVTLEGTIQSLHERDILESAVWAAPGVKAVDDRLTIA